MVSPRPDFYFSVNWILFYQIVILWICTFSWIQHSEIWQKPNIACGLEIVERSFGTSQDSILKKNRGYLNWTGVLRSVVLLWRAGERLIWVMDLWTVAVFQKTSLAGNDRWKMSETSHRRPDLAHSPPPYLLHHYDHPPLRRPHHHPHHHQSLTLDVCTSEQISANIAGRPTVWMSECL